MKEERSRRLYDGITLVDDDLVEEALADRPKRARPWVRWAAAAACVCIVAVGALALRSNGGTAITAPDPENTASKPVESNVQQEPVEASEPVMGPDGDSEPGAIVPMIEAFGQSTYSGDMAVANGGCVFSDSLTAAMANYGDSVRYRVMIEFFRDGVQIDAGDALARRECDRLADAGYLVALETYNDGSLEHHCFTIHATAEQLRNYPLSGDLGCHFLLYGEYFGETSTPAPEVFNGADSLP